MKTTGKLIIFIFTLLALAASAYAQSPREQLNQMVEQLQKTPNDNTLREKIIKLATSIKPAPAIPEEANRAFVKGNVFQKEAKDASGYELAISAYREALRVAPWWGDAYFNFAVAQESAGKFDEAIASTKLYLASASAGSVEAREAQNRIYALEAKSEIVSREAMNKQEKANREKAAEADKFAWLLGNWTLEYPAFPGNGMRVRLVKSGDTIIDADNNLRWRGTIQTSGDIVWEVKSQLPICALEGRWLPLKVNFSGDRRRATVISPTAMVGECVIKYPSYMSAEMIRN